MQGEPDREIRYHPDHCRVLNTRDDPDLAPAHLAGLDLNAEDPLEALCPGHRPVPLGGCTRVRRGGCPPPGRRDLGPPAIVRLEDHVGGAIPVGSVRYAASLPMRDFEDALQVVAAVACGAHAVATRNTRDYVRSPVRAATPDTLLKELTK